MRTRHRQTVEIHPRGGGTTRRIRAIPPRYIRPCPLLAIHQHRHPLTQHIEHLQPHRRRHRQLIGNQRRGIERIGIVLPQPNRLRQHESPTRRQRQRKLPRLVGGGLSHRPSAQIRYVKQHHLRTRHRRPIRQPHVTRNDRRRNRTRVNRDQQANKTDHEKRHKSL